MNNLLSFIFLFLTTNVLAQSVNWELAKDKDGIMVYTRESEGSPVKEFKAITTLNGTVEQVVSAIKHFDDYAQWYDHCKTSYLISKSEEERIYRIEMAMPFPFSNRDMICSMRVIKNDDWLEVNIIKVEDVLDEFDGIVRMPIGEGGWRLKQIAPNKVEVHHQFKGDPAGSIPSGIVNMFLVAGPINTLTQLQEYLDQ